MPSQTNKSDKAVAPTNNCINVEILNYRFDAEVIL